MALYKNHSQYKQKVCNHSSLRKNHKLRMARVIYVAGNFILLTKTDLHTFFKVCMRSLLTYCRHCPAFSWQLRMDSTNLGGLIAGRVRVVIHPLIFKAVSSISGTAGQRQNVVLPLKLATKYSAVRISSCVLGFFFFSYRKSLRS